MTDASDWAGTVGATWASEWQRTDRSFGALAARLDAAILAAAPAGTGRALDIGCGAGATSIALATARPDLDVIGVDLSPALLTAARDRAAGIVAPAGIAQQPAHAIGIGEGERARRPLARRYGRTANLTFVAGDVLSAAADLAPLDLLVSRHGVMFFAEPVAAFAALHAAARPGAALVFSCFREPAANDWATAVAAAVDGASVSPREGAPGPFAFADADRVRRLLRDAGWRDIAAEPVDYVNRAGAGDDPIADAVSFFSRIGPAAPLLRDVPPVAREAALARIATVCAAHRTGNAVDFPAAAWLWTARA